MATAVDRIREAGRRVPAWGWALAFSVALCLPRLSHSGFWDPWELKLAEQARDVAASNDLFDVTAGGRYPGTRPLGTLLSALGIRLFGASELGARFFIALSALGALMAVYWAGAGLLRRRAAVLSTLALGTMPLFVMEARQLTSDAPLIAALALALGGFGRFAWPPNGRRRARDAAAGLCGLAIGAYAGGLLVGALLPLAALFATEILCLGLTPRDPVASPPSDGTGPLSAAGIVLAPGSSAEPTPDAPPNAELRAGDGDLSPKRSYGASLLGAHPAIGIAWRLGVVIGLALAAVHLAPGRYSFALGGVPRSGPGTHTFEALVRQLGFGLFPWSALAFFALARPLIRLDGEGVDTHPRLAFVELNFLLFAGFGFALSSLVNVLTGDARYVALPAIALAVGAFLDEALEGNRPEPVAGLLMAIGTMVVARDFFLAPEELASVAVQDKIKWPPSLSIGDLFLVVGFVAAAGVYGGLAARGRAIGKVAAPDLSGAGRWRRTFDRLVIDAGRFGLQAAVAVAVVFAFYLAEDLVPRLSTHLSFKPVLESYGKFAHPGDKIGKYHVEGHGSSFYSKQALIELPNQDGVVRFLRDPERVFALVSADELASLDAALKQAGVSYYVVDASSSRFLLLTNRLEAGQRDQNPLAQNVWTPPTASSEGSAAAKPPWTWRIPLDVTFGDAVELVGADFPAEVRRPGKIPLDLIFRIKARPPGTYKIFVHFDGPAAPRVIGDHDPVNHTFATSYWLPGEYIRDHSETDVPLMTTPAGTYTVYMGFWPGGEGKRLKVTAGPNDGADRVRLGTLEIK